MCITLSSLSRKRCGSDDCERCRQQNQTDHGAPRKRLLKMIARACCELFSGIGVVLQQHIEHLQAAQYHSLGSGPGNFVFAFVVTAIESARFSCYSLSHMLSPRLTTWIRQVAISHETMDALGVVFGDRLRRCRWWSSG